MFVYDRSQILAGQFWRLVTGHLVHFSTSHLLLNLGGFVSLLSVLYRFKMRVSMLRLVLASGLMSLGLLVFAPNISTYGGLSALVTGLAVVFIMQIAQTKHRAVALFLLLLLTGKVLRDFLYPGAQFIQYSTATHTAPLAHVLGAVGAMAMVSRAFPN
jgi:rhomboid family GlyGly-CTERM serine protease